MNPVNFHTGVMVVKPDRDEFDRLMSLLVNQEAYSYDGADQGFLTFVFHGMEAAPLFDIKDVIDNGNQPLDAPKMRLPTAYNINHVYFYISFDWEVYRRSRHHFSDRELPFLSIGYPIAPLCKV